MAERVHCPAAAEVPELVHELLPLPTTSPATTQDAAEMDDPVVVTYASTHPSQQLTSGRTLSLQEY